MTATRVVSPIVTGLILAGWLSTATRAEAQPPGADLGGVGEVVREEAEQAEEDLLHGTQEHADDNPLEFKKDLALWTAVVFLGVLAVLWKFAWGPIVEGLQRRETGIADQIARAEQSNQQARQLLSEYEQKLADSTGEVRAIFEKARRDAETVGQGIVDKARQDSEIQKQRALEQIEVATADALKELAGQSANLAVDLAGKIVRAQLKPEDHTKLIERAVADFTAKASRKNGASRPNTD